MQEAIDAYQGKATCINALSRTELTDLHDELEQTMRRVSLAMQNTIGDRGLGSK